MGTVRGDARGRMWKLSRALSQRKELWCPYGVVAQHYGRAGLCHPRFTEGGGCGHLWGSMCFLIRVIKCSEWRTTKKRILLLLVLFWCGIHQLDFQLLLKIGKILSYNSGKNDQSGKKEFKEINDHLLNAVHKMHIIQAIYFLEKIRQYQNFWTSAQEESRV